MNVLACAYLTSDCVVSGGADKKLSIFHIPSAFTAVHQASQLTSSELRLSAPVVIIEARPTKQGVMVFVIILQPLFYRIKFAFLSHGLHLNASNHCQLVVPRRRMWMLWINRKVKTLPTPFSWVVAWMESCRCTFFNETKTIERHALQRLGMPGCKNMQN